MQDLPQQAPQQVVIHQVAPTKVLKELNVKLPSIKEGEELAFNDAKPMKKEAYEKLPCSEQDKAHIHQIITTLAENGKLSLLFKQNELKELGEKIGHLHPLKFLSAIFCSPDLKERMSQFFGDYFKRNAFMKEVGSGLTAEAESGGLNALYIEKFAQEVNVPLEKIHSFFDIQDWEGLVKYLIEG